VRRGKAALERELARVLRLRIRQDKPQGTAA
jgi:hypothetical protein